MNLWDDEAFIRIAGRLVDSARRTGAVVELPGAFGMATTAALLAGDFPAAASFIDQTDSMIAITGMVGAPHGKLALAAWQGRTDAESGHVADGRAAGLGIPAYTAALLYNGLGRYEEACAPALRAVEYPHNLSSSNWGMTELIEAAVRAGTPQVATGARSRLADMARVSGTDWALGVAARSEALMVDDQLAEALYVEAVDRLGRTRMAVDLARAHLLYGEWLRRQRRRLDARGQLRTAHGYFADFGMEAFAERARVELEATGEHARRRNVERRGDLTPQEAQIARLARDGLSNAEIGARLFISKHTVEYHLRKVFTKLGINSRTKLVHSLPPGPSSALLP
jgi:DNA-binding CsgD family transcriptional regulator